MNEPQVTVCTVTHNSSEELDGYCEALAQVQGVRLEVVVVDCASHDDTVDRLRTRLRKLPWPSTLLPLEANLGFAGGMNAALAQGQRAPFVLSLNPDARPEADFVGALLECALSEERIAAVAGKLVRPALSQSDDEGRAQRTLDACGMWLSLDGRHFDRGSGEADRGQFDRAARVFGATGAASLFRREALDDVALSDGDRFDSWFHSYREDAELCFRLRARGWEVVYEPRARATHARHNLPSRRRAMSAFVNYHSLKNRFLLREYHLRAIWPWRSRWRASLRDLGIFAYVGLLERSSIAAYRWLWRERARIRERAREVHAQRRIEPAELAAWLGVSDQPLRAPHKPPN